MQEKNNKEMLIDIKDLFYHLLYRWRSFLVAIIIGAIALCGYQYYSIQSVHSKGELTKEEKQYETDLQEYDLSLKDAQNKVGSYSRLIQAGNEYRSESLLRQLNLNNVWTAERKYIVRVDQKEIDALPAGSNIDLADSVIPIYVNAMAVDINDEELQEAFGTTNLGYASEVVIIFPTTTDNTIAVQAIGATREEAETRLKFVEKRINKLKEGMAQEICKHDLMTIDGNTKQGVYKSIEKGKETSLQTQLREDDKQQAEYLKELKENQSKLINLSEQGVPAKPGLHLGRMAVIGALLGGLLMLFIYIVKYLGENKLRIAAQLPAEYGVPVFGEFLSSRARRPGKGIDGLIEKREFRNSQQDPEVIYGNICALIGNDEEKKTLLLSTLEEDTIKDVVDELGKRLDGKKAFDSQADFTNNGNAIETVKDYDTIVLIEKKHKTKLRDLNRTAELLNIEKAKVSGAIVL